MIRRWWRSAACLVLASASISVGAAPGAESSPLYLEIKTKAPGNQSLKVFAGRKAELTLTLTAAREIEPELRADLFATAQTLAAPLARDISLPVERAGPKRPGVQRFHFAVELPAVTRPQNYVLRLRTRTAETEPWLPLPVVTLEAVMETWRATLRAFTARIPSGRLAADEKLAEIFTRADAKVAAAAGSPAEDENVRVWFAENEPEPAATSGEKTLWIVFKAEVPGGIATKRPESGPTVLLVDAGILAALATDPAAQEILERALSTAEVFLSPSLPQN